MVSDPGRLALRAPDRLDAAAVHEFLFVQRLGLAPQRVARQQGVDRPERTRSRRWTPTRRSSVAAELFTRQVAGTREGNPVQRERDAGAGHVLSIAQHRDRRSDLAEAGRSIVGRRGSCGGILLRAFRRQVRGTSCGSNAVITPQNPPCQTLCVRRTSDEPFLAVGDAWIDKPNLQTVTRGEGGVSRPFDTRGGNASADAQQL